MNARPGLQTEIIAMRLWSYAAPRGWDCTAREVADALGLSARTIGAVARFKGWSGRLRSTQAHGIDMTAQSGMMHGFDDMGAA